MPSHCVECGAEMCVAEAKLYMECEGCQRLLGRKTRVRDLNRPGTEQAGRPSVIWTTTWGDPFDPQDEGD